MGTPKGYIESSWDAPKTKDEDKEQFHTVDMSAKNSVELTWNTVIQKINPKKFVYEYDGPIEDEDGQRPRKKENTNKFTIFSSDDKPLIYIDENYNFKIVDKVNIDEASSEFLSAIADYIPNDKVSPIQAKAALVFCTAALKLLDKKIDKSCLSEEELMMLNKALAKSNEIFYR